MNILVLGAGGNAGMNFIKCLKIAPHNLTVHGADRNQYYRKTIKADFVADINFDSEAKKLESIKSYVEQHQISFIHAQPDAEVEFLLRHKAEFPRLIFDHSLEAFNCFSDKLKCQQKWGPSFHNYRVCSLQQAFDKPDLFTEIKERGKGIVWFRAIKGAGSKAALPVSDINEAIYWGDYWIKRLPGTTRSDYMLCQYLPGREYAVQTFWVNGHVMQSQARERLLPFFGAQSPSGQSSTAAVARTVNNKKIYQAAYEAIRLIQEIPHGIYCVDLKEDAEQNIIPTEVNYGRFFTTTDFFAALDVNTPVAYVHNHAFGARVRRVESVKKEYYWIRGLDREPVLHDNDRLL